MKRQITASRREILVLLRRGGPQSVDNLSAQLGITPVGVRKHLDTLEIDGLVRSEAERRKVGRPVQLYSLTDAADDLFPKAYDAMLLSLLRQVRRIGGEDLLRQVLKGRQEELATAFRERAAGAQTLEERVEILMRLRDEAGYMAECAREDGRFVLREYNCAVCRVAREFSQVCDSEMDLFRGVLGDGVRVEREGRAQTDGRCTYVISEA